MPPGCKYFWNSFTWIQRAWYSFSISFHMRNSLFHFPKRPYGSYIWFILLQSQGDEHISYWQIIDMNAIAALVNYSNKTKNIHNKFCDECWKYYHFYAAVGILSINFINFISVSYRTAHKNDVNFVWLYLLLTVISIYIYHSEKWYLCKIIIVFVKCSIESMFLNEWTIFVPKNVWGFLNLRFP